LVLRRCSRAFSGRPPNEDASRLFDPKEPFASLATLATEQRAVDMRLVAVCTARSDDDLDRPVTLVRKKGHWGSAYISSSRLGVAGADVARFLRGILMSLLCMCQVHIPAGHS
jgi:hypothetical protein